MRGKNQEQYNKMKVIKEGNQRNYNTISNQSNTFESHPSQKSTQKDTYYISGRTIKQTDQNNKNIYSPNKQEPQTNYTVTSHQNMQTNISQNSSNQMGHRIEKRIYVNKGRGNTEEFRIKQVGSNNAKGKDDIQQQYVRKPVEKNVEKRGRLIEVSNQNHNRAKSYLSDRKPLNKLAILDKSLKEKKLPKSVECKRKTIYRGGDYNNIQITHIISTTKPNLDKYDFHIIETLSRVELDKKPLDLKKIKSQIKKDDTAKSTFKSSCDGRIIAPINRKKIQKTTIYQHAAGIGMTDLAPEKINSTYYTSGLIKLPKRIRPREPPVIQIIEVFRSQQSSLNDRNRSIDNKYNTNNIFNKTYNNSNQKMNKSITSNDFISNNNIIAEKTTNSQKIKPNENENKVKNIYTNINNNSSLNNYNSSPVNINKDYNNKKDIRNNNIITVNKKENNKEISTSFNNNQSTYNKDNIKGISQIEISPERKSEIQAIKYNDINGNLSDSKGIKQTVSNNFYSKNEFKEDFKNKSINMIPDRNSLQPNNIFGIKSEQGSIRGSMNSPSKIVINPSINYQQKNSEKSNIQSNISPRIEIKPSEIKYNRNAQTINQKLDKNSDYNISKPFESTPPIIELKKKYNKNQAINDRKNENITFGTKIIKNNDKLPDKPTNIIQPSSINNNIKNINNDKPFSRDRNEVINSSKIYPPKTNVNNYNQISHNKKIAPLKIEIDLNEEDKQISKINNNKNDKIPPTKTEVTNNYSTNPINNKYNSINQKSPQRTNINSRYNTNQNSINASRKSPPKINIHTNVNNKQSPQRINVNARYNNQSSNNKNNRSSPQKQTINSNYNTIKTSYERDNKTSPLQTSINDRYNTIQSSYSHKSPVQVEINLDKKSSQPSSNKNSQKIKTREDISNKYNIKPTNIFNNNTQVHPSDIDTNKTKYNIIPKEETKNVTPKEIYPDNQINPYPKQDNKISNNYNVSPQKVENIKPSNYVSPTTKIENRQQETTKIESRQINNYANPATKIKISQQENNIHPTTKFDNKQPINYTRQTKQINNNYVRPTIKIENKKQDNNTLPNTNIEKNYIYQTKSENRQPVNYTRPSGKIENRQPINYPQQSENKQQEKYIRPTAKIENKM